MEKIVEGLVVSHLSKHPMPWQIVGVTPCLIVDALNATVCQFDNFQDADRVMKIAGKLNPKVESDAKDTQQQNSDSFEPSFEHDGYGHGV